MMQFPRYAKTDDDRLMDDEANVFALAFLMPEQKFRAVWAANNGDVGRVADHFMVLMFHARIRAKHLGLLPNAK